ncbi:uncharacterized protein LOC103026616 [Astyanax mexicanus]|uniref:uncharacterized protein LOC103026616 n=1 Tax=Astyanax mexicanus TaxID=7994 RepID=UPI0020CAA80C|nr:uncharacterized protein LOC103026616 [Astyanax mexicanus]
MPGWPVGLDVSVCAARPTAQRASAAAGHTVPHTPPQNSSKQEKELHPGPVSFTLPEQGQLLEEVLFVELCREEVQKLLTTYKEEAKRLLPAPPKRKRHQYRHNKLHMKSRSRAYDKCFVINTLTEWQLTELVERFKEEGIDEESFLLLDEATINQLIPRAGPRLKFLQKFRNFVGSPVVAPVTPPTSSDVISTATHPAPMEEQAAASVVPVNQLIQTIYIIPQFDVRQVLAGLPDGKQIVQSLEDANVTTTSQRRLLVRILVSHLIEKFGENPSSETKLALASDLVQSFPCLKDSSSSGREIWYTPGRYHRLATAFLEERLRNIRKRLRSISRSRSMAQASPQTPRDGASAKALIPECSISDERAAQLKEWLRNNSQPLSQGLWRGAKLFIFNRFPLF